MQMGYLFIDAIQDFFWPNSQISYDHQERAFKNPTKLKKHTVSYVVIDVQQNIFSSRQNLFNLEGGV